MTKTSNFRGNKTRDKNKTKIKNARIIRRAPSNTADVQARNAANESNSSDKNGSHLYTPSAGPSNIIYKSN